MVRWYASEGEGTLGMDEILRAILTSRVYEVANETSLDVAPRLSKRLEPESIDHLLVLMTADASGRPPKPFRLPQTVLDLRAKAEELQVQAKAPAPIIMGRHLFRFGLEPGPEFKVLLDEAYEAQLEGKFSDLEGGLHWLREVKRLHPL